jgi:hypothetical protein
MPPETQTTGPNDDAADALPAPPPRPVPRRRGPRRLPTAVRGVLLLIAAGWVIVFGIAFWLNPYRTDSGETGVRTHGTHQQLGLPPCGFLRMTGKPCPSCGMTTSFSLTMHGDLANAAQANWVGVVLVGYGMLLVPWAAVSAWRGRYLWVRSLEWLVMWSVSAFLVLILSRWVAVLFWH